MTGTDSGGFRFVSHHRRGLIALPGVAGTGTVSASAVLSGSVSRRRSTRPLRSAMTDLSTRSTFSSWRVTTSLSRSPR